MLQSSKDLTLSHSFGWGTAFLGGVPQNEVESRRSDHEAEQLDKHMATTNRAGRHEQYMQRDIAVSESLWRRAHAGLDISQQPSSRWTSQPVSFKCLVGAL